MLRIGIDATSIPPNRAGVGVYIFNLVKHLAEVDEKNYYFVFASPSIISEWNIKRKNYKFIPIYHKFRFQRIVWEQTMLPFFITKFKLNILHSPHYTIPMIKKCYSVVTFHDMIFFICPKVHNYFKKIFFKKMISFSVKHADAIIAVSENTKEDILKFFKISKSKIYVTLEAIDSSFKPLPVNMTERVCQKYGLKLENFLLFTGVLEPRKNIPMLLKSFKELLKKGYNMKLAIVGKRGWMYDEIFLMVKQLKLEDDVIFTGYVPADELAYLYNGASIFVYPSLYEGFGLPVLEALACGTPVITSNISSMPEVVGDAGLKINPHNSEELLRAMEKIIKDPSLSKTLSEKGLKQAAKFSWSKTAIETIKVYENIYETKNKKINCP